LTTCKISNKHNFGKRSCFSFQLFIWGLVVFVAKNAKTRRHTRTPARTHTHTLFLSIPTLVTRVSFFLHIIFAALGRSFYLLKCSINYTQYVTNVTD